MITILSIGSGIVAISINKALVDQRFRTEVGLIVDEMRLAQDLMLILGTDVHLNFSENDHGDGIKYWLELETNLPENVQREVLRKKKFLKTVKGVFLADELVSEIKEKHIDVKFLSNGSVMSKGIMRLSTTDKESSPKDALQSYICLAGYPRPISSYDKKEDAEKVCLKLEDDLDDRLTQDTIQRLPEKVKKLDSPKVETNSEDQKNNKKKGDEKKTEKNAEEKK